MNKRRDRVTISQVANAAGVTKSSVSRAFSKPEMLLPETVNKIKEVATELGYIPNHAARALSTGRIGNLGMIVPDVANPFFPPMIRGAQDEADRGAFCVLLGNSNEDPEQEDRLISRLIGQVEGLVLASSRLPESRIREFADLRPIVLINREVDSLCRVLIDSTNGLNSAVQHLADLGHKRVAYVSGPATSWSNTSRMAAVQSACAKLGMELICMPAQVASYEAGENVTSKLLESGATAAIAFDDLTAHGILGGLTQRGVSVPDDFSIVGCDDVLGKFTHPPLTSISNRSNQAGSLAVSLLSDMLRTNTTNDGCYALDTELVLRASTGGIGRVVTT